MRYTSFLVFGLLSSAFPIAAQSNTPTLTVDAAATRHPINPDIYGIVNYGLDPVFALEIHLPNTRWGGDGTTRYNWQVDSSNSGFDWYFMGGSGSTTATPGAGPDTMIKAFKPAGTRPLITIPIIPYINQSSAWGCSFPVSVYGAQQSTDPYVHPNGDSCGNSIATSGKQLTDTNIYANHINNSPQFQQNWIVHLLLDFGHSNKGGVPYYQLDNEPSGWGNTHRDVEPTGATYDTIFRLGSEYAAMIKNTDQTASVLGPSDFSLGGWIGSTADMQEHGGLYAGQWYLQRMQAYQTAHNARILDYFDEHVYGGSTTDDTYELQSTRSLWDPTYNSGTWVEQYHFGNMQLIPRFKGWITQYYPGTKLAFSEYSWGGHKTLVGALAEADILGIFGKQQVDFANMWDAPASTDPTAYTFRLFRNYDGDGAMFGDVSIGASSYDQTQLSVYASQRTSDKALTIVVINKTANEVTSGLTLANFNPAVAAHLYNYSAANLLAIVAQPDLTVTNDAISASFPALSESVIVVPQSTAPLVRTGWAATASATATGNFDSLSQHAASALDGNVASRWSSGHTQREGDWFEVDMGATKSFSSLIINSGTSINDYPRAYQIFTSSNGTAWTGPIAQGTGTSALVTATFPTQMARYLKIVQTGAASTSPWSIAELNLIP